MPTPRPDTSVTTSAVEKPGAKISCQTSASLIESDTARPFCAALARIRSRFRPAPSSATSITILPPWWPADRNKRPASDLPAAARACGISMPWSMLFRTRWVSGSTMRSIRPLSSSVAAPWVMKSTFLPSLPARSRTMRGKRENTKSIGIMRIDITASCSSRVLRVSWDTDDSRRSCSIGSSPLERCSIMAWVITSSPIRLINWSTFSTETRIEDDSAPLSLFFACLLFQRFHDFDGGRGLRRGRIDAGQCADLLDRLEEAVAAFVVREFGARRRRVVGRIEEAVALLFLDAGAFARLDRALLRRQCRRFENLQVVRIEHERADGDDVVQALVGRDDQRAAPARRAA